MIYIHVPYCRTHCLYCAFYSELLRGGSDAFVDALCAEIRAELGQTGAGESAAACLRFAKPDTLYVGGGTPSLLGVDALGRILDTLASYGYADFEEFTLEANPDDITQDYARGLKLLGINRISMGVQSFDDRVLHRMGRRHDSAGALNAYRILREAGFDNLSIDLIFGFDAAGGELESISRGLELLKDYGGLPEHVSCYQLGIEEGSGLDKLLSRGLLTLPSDEDCAQRYLAICSLFKGLGYEHYEISNWNLGGCRRSLHNSSYWKHLPYLGLGPGAHSLILDGESWVRRWNKADLDAYMRAAREGCFDTVRESECLTSEQFRNESIMLGLRTSDGVSRELLCGRGAGQTAALSRLVPVSGPVSDRLRIPESGSPSDSLRIPESGWFISDSIIVDLL